MQTVAHLGRYEVVQRLAEGGMAQLLLAKLNGAAGFEKFVVLKRVHPGLRAKKEYVEMLRQEAILAARLSHPNIVHVYDFEEAHGEAFIVMEFIQGWDLVRLQHRAQKLGRSLPPEFVAFVIGRVCEALHHAHQLTDTDGAPLNLVHRDVSPENILVTFSGGVKLVDFGIAKVTGPHLIKTSAGILKGKYAYMSPEQLLARQVDARADQFAAAVVMFELLTGRHPFVRDSLVATINAIAFEPLPAPGAISGPLPDALARVLTQALEKDPAQRFKTADAMAEPLLKFAACSPDQRVSETQVEAIMTSLFDSEEPIVAGAPLPSTVSVLESETIVDPVNEELDLMLGVRVDALEPVVDVHPPDLTADGSTWSDGFAARTAPSDPLTDGQEQITDRATAVDEPHGVSTDSALTDVAAFKPEQIELQSDSVRDASVASAPVEAVQVSALGVSAIPQPVEVLPLTTHEASVIPLLPRGQPPVSREPSASPDSIDPTLDAFESQRLKGQFKTVLMLGVMLVMLFAFAMFMASTASTSDGAPRAVFAPRIP